jgi:hypothetical protein
MLNKICVRLVGGLGNQLFIYAFGLANALRSGKQLVIDDVSGFSKRDIYNGELQLSGYSIKGLFISKSKYKYLFANRYFWFLARTLGLSYVEKDETAFDALAINTSGFFEGYWQSYLYFDEYKDIIKSNFQLTNKDNPKICDLKNKILNAENSVAIGMRFYEAFPGDAEKYGVMNESYYSNAMDLLDSKIENLTYFVFSMNIERAKNELAKYNDKDIIFVNPLESKTDASLDMYLMSLCDHFIISNSTMYWWAAYLGESEESVVVSPAAGLLNKDSLPTHWVKLV